jgi:hypothetical protein
MNNNQLLIDAFSYFARFPLLAGVKEVFNNTATSGIAGYAAFKQSIDALTPNSLVPGIKHYVFGVDEARVRKRIGSFSDFYLMVDYGQLRFPQSSERVITDAFYLAATVAIPFSRAEINDAEELLLTQQAYTYLMAIRAQLIADDRESLTRHLAIAPDADPFNAPELNNSIGWTLMMQRTGVLQR